MASKPEIAGAIQAGVNRARSTFGQLTESQLDTKVHDGPEGWTACQILAHLAGRQETYEMLIGIAFQSNGAPSGVLDIDSWNQRLVVERTGMTRDELLQEFEAVHLELISRVESFRDDQLNLPVVLPNRETTLGDVLLGSGGMHSIQHAEEVAHALDLPN
ncbi:MAG: DinB family protein [Thermomicrobiaceae bacterium]